MPPAHGRLATRIELPLDREHVFEFFSNASNLGVITPRELHFKMHTPQPVVMAEGTLIDYTIRLWGVPIRWRTRIASWDPPHSFSDEQLRGPYKSWVHTHRFVTVPGGTVIEDEVLWSLPFGWMGAIVAPLVRRQIDHIFAFRGERVRALLVPDGTSTT